MTIVLPKCARTVASNAPCTRSWSDRLSTREDDCVRIAAPVGSTVTTHELIEGESVAFGARVVLAEIRVDDDVGESERVLDDVGRLERTWVRTRDQDIRIDLLRRRQPIAQFGCLQLAEIRQPDTRTRAAKNPAHRDDGLAVADEDDSGLAHANFSTKPSSWRRLRHS
jgi:hypothetical protein